jgi:drug/metabolite transporter (DMT)-like permease
MDSADPRVSQARPTGAAMGEITGVLAAVLSSTLGGMAIGATRHVIAATDPWTLGAFRFGIGCLLLSPIAAFGKRPWPRPRDMFGVIVLGLLFFGLFPILFNASLAFTTAARGALALSTLPLLTMLAGAIAGVEAMTLQKSSGVLLAVGGVASALMSGLSDAPAGVWRGDLLMVGAAICMALYNIWSKPYIQRSGAVPFTVVAMAAGALSLLLLAWTSGGLAAVRRFGAPEWSAIGFLGVLGSAATFYLWSFALERTTPTRVAVSVTVNPIAAAIFGALLLHEPIGWNFLIGFAAVITGIGIATANRAGEQASAKRNPQMIGD